MTVQTEAATRDTEPTGYANGQAQKEDGRVPADEAHDAALEAIAEEEQRFRERPLVRRIYTCDQCGHETLTVGGLLDWRAFAACRAAVERGDADQSTSLPVRHPFVTARPYARSWKAYSFPSSEPT